MIFINTHAHTQKGYNIEIFCSKDHSVHTTYIFAKYKKTDYLAVS